MKDYSGEKAIRIMKILSESKNPYGDLAKLKRVNVDILYQNHIRITPKEFCSLFGTAR